MRSPGATLALAGSIAGILTGCDRQPRVSDFEVVATFPHDASAYTQGLLTVDSVLYESTGGYGRSDVRRVDLRTGAVLARQGLAANRFGEGLSLHDGRLFQLTWREHVAYVYEATSLALADSFAFEGEGWGLASDGRHLYLSDGSDSVRVLDPRTFTVERVLHVRYQDQPLRQLNELEFFQGALLANVYGTNWVAVIDPEQGQVKRMLDFAALYPKRAFGAEVMNGIAVSPDGQQLLLTGKLWPTLFQVRVLTPADTQ